MKGTHFVLVKHWKHWKLEIRFNMFETNRIHTLRCLYYTCILCILLCYIVLHSM